MCRNYTQQAEDYFSKDNPGLSEICAIKKHKLCKKINCMCYCQHGKVKDMGVGRYAKN